MRFDGETYNPALDKERLTRQLDFVREVMLDARWRTLHDISTLTGYPEASVSARIRDLRKTRFGGHEVQRRRRTKGTFEYRVLAREETDQQRIPWGELPEDAARRGGLPVE